MTVKLAAILAGSALGAFAAAYWIANGSAMMAAFATVICL